ncbi:hypothetical protein [Mesobacillus selenatarsenatis]|uniref:Uncharacterized protein n=1 Tax=Mesobacillus selenatarsenatis TaxID=388741 RepID=A0A846TSV9_9BACI|nr:hypothetical protein [Mesobacillus selenatarsenatis]NKE05461.1 hypothetical protein [Mesobacillus selenatarsenatis]
MSVYTTMLLLAGAGVLVAGLFYTWSFGKGQKRAHGNLDSQAPEAVQEHAYIRNPIFLTYIIVISIALLFVVYYAVTTGTGY